jgi:hypothetical protein
MILLWNRTSLFGNSNLTIIGTTIIKRFIPGNGIDLQTAKWHYVSSPTSAPTAVTFFDALLHSYNEPLQKWDAVLYPSSSLFIGQGYSTAMPCDFAKINKNS